VKLIVGLGNPGRSYANDRHNIGFRCLGHFAQKHGISIRRRKSRAKLGTGEVAGNMVVLAKPQTFMNLSGRAVGPLVQWLGVSLKDMLVIYDDLDLPLGRVRIRERGSSAGHKGVESIITSLGSDEFPRIRVGIGRPEGDVISYVLKGFTAEERGIVSQVMVTVCEAIYCILNEGIVVAMNRYN
jgi:PTH1 family peptidyl-tRNA hydrolase